MEKRAATPRCRDLILLLDESEENERKTMQLIPAVVGSSGVKYRGGGGVHFFENMLGRMQASTSMGPASIPR